MWAASAVTIAYCSRRVRRESDDSTIPLMGVLGAFIFAAQMINFTIPVTGSSGHLGGGLLLAILLGPYAAFLTIASVLMVQALFFADGGLLALGCNIFNLGFFPAFLAYPLFYKRIIGQQPSAQKIMIASCAASIAGLQMGSFAVVLETVSSGISSLPFPAFLALMQPIHLAIGIVEGLVTASVVSFVYTARPDVMHCALKDRPTPIHPLRNILLSFLVVAVMTAGIVSWFASKDPDGLEWAVTRVAGRMGLKGPEQGLHATLANLQKRSAILPGYSFRNPAETQQEDLINRIGTSLAGVVGGLFTLGLALLIGFVVKRRSKTA
jgi:cobalt/nickel transport system permease protein